MRDKASRWGGGFSVFGFASVSGSGPSRRFLKSSPMKYISAMADRFVYTSTRLYGVMFLCYGLLSLFLLLGRYYIEQAAELATSSWLVGLIFAVLGMILLIFERPICAALQDFPISDFILFEFLSIRRMDKAEKGRGITLLPAMLIGFVPAVVSLFVPPLYVVGAIGIAAFVALSFGTPELPFITAIVIAPYLSPIPDGGMILSLLTVLAFVSFTVKVMLGKRVYSFCIYDACLLVLSILFIVGGIVAGNVGGALVMVALTLGYIPASNIIMNRRLADRAVNALIVSSVPVTVLGLVRAIVAFLGGPVPEQMIFSSTDSYGAYILVAALLSLFFALEKKSRFKKAVYSAVFALNLAGLVLLWHLGLWFTAVVTLIAALILKTRAIRKEALIPLLVLPYLLFLLPDGVFQTLSEHLALSPTVAELFAEWELSLAAFKEHAFWGAGLGASQNEANTILSLGVQFGAPAAVIFVFMIMACIVHYSVFVPYMRNSLLSFTAASSVLSLFALFSFGMSSDVFADITVYYLFVVVLGIFVASLRISKSEYDARLGYYGDQISADSSVIDVRISR